jgi:hypothetical protein
VEASIPPTHTVHAFFKYRQKTLSSTFRVFSEKIILNSYIIYYFNTTYPERVLEARAISRRKAAITGAVSGRTPRHS